MLAIAWPDRHPVGWNGEVPAAVPFFPTAPLLDLLSNPHPTDAHAVGYLVGAAEAVPRLNKGALATLAERGEPAVLWTAFVDLDRANHKPWRSRGAAEKTVAALAVTFPLAAVYSTRAGARLVWRLDAGVPCDLANGWLAAHLAVIAARWAAAPKTGLAHLSVDLDCAQWTRCFRLPFVKRQGGRAFDPVLDLGGLAEGATLPRGDLGSLESEAPGTAIARVPKDRELPPLTPPPAWHVELLRGTAAGDALARKVAKGAVLAEAGGRDTAMMKAIGVAARALGNDATPAAVFHLLAPSVEAMAAAGSHLTLSKLWDRAQEITAREAADRGERIAATMARGDSPVIVVSGSRFHVLDADGLGYGPAVPAVALTAELRDRRPELPRLTARGAPLPIATLVDRLGTVADRVIAVMGEDRTTFTRSDRTLRLRACVRRPAEAERSAEVAEWLEALIPDPAVRAAVLNWLATCVDLARPTAALYLQGPRGGGKSLFVKGLASLWGAPPVTFEAAIGRFNRTALTACPIVHLSEGLGFLGDGRRRNVSSAFRSLVADGVHRVEEKHEVAGDLLGHPRVIVAANNDEALPLGGHHTRDDLAAIAQRILHVRTAAAEVTWTEAEGWLADEEGGPGAIARHVLWLASTREVAIGGRFLVEGIEGDYHRGLVLKSGENAQILGAIGAALLKGGRQASAMPRRGAALVNVARLHGQWRALVDEEAPRPTRSAVARALRELSTTGSSVSERTEGAVLRYWPIPGDLVVRIAEAHGVPGAERIASILRGEAEAAAEGGAVVPFRA